MRVFIKKFINLKMMSKREGSPKSIVKNQNIYKFIKIQVN
jgi:hypothetical protein